jgi:hypothetical protein
MSTHWLTAALAALLCGCGAGTEAPPAAPPTTSTMPTAAPASTPPSSRAAAIREWESIAQEHFKKSATALKEVSDASTAEDEEGLREGCQRLHDANSVELQEDLPTPDRQLTAELQRMIDDMNVATHACLRFALGRNPTDADAYQEYLARSVEHLQRAKAILTAAKQ